VVIDARPIACIPMILQKEVWKCEYLFVDDFNQYM